MSKLPITLMIEIVQISVKDNIKCSSYKVEPLKRTPTRRVLETRCKSTHIISYNNGLCLNFVKFLIFKPYKTKNPLKNIR